jgi:hypothetical protein
MDHHHRMYGFEVRLLSGNAEEGLVHLPASWHHVPQTAEENMLRVGVEIGA